MSERKIKARIAARKAATDLITEWLPLLEWEDGTGADYADSFCKTIRAHLPQKKQERIEEESRTPLSRLAAIRMPFGKYEGRRLDEIDPAYLDWLCAEQEGFYRTLREYLKHPELI